MVSKWTSTPFETLEDAHQIATRLELNPSAIIDTGQGFRSFQTKTGRAVSIIAQKVDGGPVLEKRLLKGRKSKVPLQDPKTPTFGEEDRLLTGPWTDSDHATLDAVRAHYQQLGPSTRHSIAFIGELMVVEYPDKDVVEYRQTNYSRVQQRVLHTTKKRGSWELSPQTSLVEVEAYWRAQYVNFDNVEALEVVLYRIGQDEYEYVVDRNTGEVWCRVLRR